MISLDGVGSQHDAQRPFASGKPSFHHVDRTITQLVEQGHAPHLSITITSRNAGGVADVVRYALERNLTFSLNFFRDNDCAAAFPDLRYEEQAMIRGLLDAFAVIEDFLPRWSVLGSVLDRGQMLTPRQRSCGVGEDYVVIDQRGRVAKCHMEIERTLGDVLNEDPLQLVRAGRATALNIVVDEIEGCRDWRSIRRRCDSKGSGCSSMPSAVSLTGAPSRQSAGRRGRRGQEPAVRCRGRGSANDRGSGGTFRSARMASRRLLISVL